MAITPSSEWTVENVLNTLQHKADAGKEPAMEVFLKSSLPAERLTNVYTDIVSGVEPGHAVVGNLRRMARSFSVKGDMSALSQIAHHSDVEAVLPSEIDDIYPKPVLE